MKKLVYILMLLIVVFSSCNPNEEIYNELDGIKEPYNATIDYTLLTKDYESASKLALANAVNKQDSTWAGYLKSFEAFNDSFPGSEYIPSLLADLFPAYNKNSVVNATFNYIAEIPSDLAVYANAEELEFLPTYYEAVSSFVGAAGYFYSDYNPDLFIANILKDSVEDATDGDYYVVSYLYSDIKPVITESEFTTIYSEDFAIEDSLGQFTATSVTGDQSWYQSSYNADNFAKISGFVSGDGASYDNEDWLISSKIDLGSYAEVYLNFNHAIKYLNDHWSELSVAISTDYVDDPATATWDVIDWADVADTALLGSDYTFRSSGDIDLSAYSGQDIYVAFKYTSNTSNAATWEIESMKVKVKAPSYEVNGSTPYTMNDVYQFSGGAWLKVDGVYCLNEKDYAAMGDPGDYNNFSSSISPRDYLPNFLKAKYPTAGEGVSKIILYKYYTGIEGTLTLADQYTYKTGEWQSTYNYIEQTTQQFLHTGTEWIFDPTVRFTMSSSDYQILVDVVKLKDPSLIDSYGTQEFYYGAGSYYSNFDLRISKRVSYDPDTYASLSTEDAIALTQQRVLEGIVVLLQKKFPNAVDQVGGFDVHYFVTYDTYNNDYSRSHVTVDYQCIQSASGSTPAEFELVGDEPVYK